MSMIIVWRRGDAGDGHEFLTLRAAGADDDADWAWRPPSGTFEVDETAEACAVRELFEETRLQLPLERIASADYPTFVVEVPAGTTIELSDEHDRYDWVPAGELIRRARPSWVGAGIRASLLSAGLVQQPLVLYDEERQFGERRFHMTFEFAAELPPPEQIATAIGVVFDGDNLVLVEHAKYGGLQPPGGHLDPGETVFDAVRREVLEEALVEVDAVQFIGYERIEPLFEIPDDYRYTVPSYQAFFAATTARMLPFAPHAEAKARHVLPPAEARACDWVTDIPELYEHALVVALGLRSSAAGTPASTG